ncbi:MAG TPA: hypothetical protein VLG50_04365 [Candidatus Saccharimonadales bacterium]|nr:hypothetical protein [Candidatus Saccharimonadales bacterium]
MNESLRSILITDLPARFVSELIGASRWAYRDSYEAVYSDNNYDEPEKKGLLPYVRRARIEKKIREVALDAGLTATVEKNSAKNTEYTLIKSGRVALTVSKSFDRGSLPALARFREQYSSINQHAAQIQMLPVLSMPFEASLYGVIIHGSSNLSHNELGFLQIGFLDSRKYRWVEAPIDLEDIMDAQSLSSQQKDPLIQLQEKNRQPRLKEKYIATDEIIKKVTL